MRRRPILRSHKEKANVSFTNSNLVMRFFPKTHTPFSTGFIMQYLVSVWQVADLPVLTAIFSLAVALVYSLFLFFRHVR